MNKPYGRGRSLVNVGMTGKIEIPAFAGMTKPGDDSKPDYPLGDDGRGVRGDGEGWMMCQRLLSISLNLDIPRFQIVQSDEILSRP